ncbi:hypothetical protein ACFUN7_14385 [Streptomyces sp. NPDC057236]|uniref:hypothetical protein n=1 Tax=Streptomyces sp. NPDC057236 TaxID=3346059 RepID=UPI00364136CA
MFTPAFGSSTRAGPAAAAPRARAPARPGPGDDPPGEEVRVTGIADQAVVVPGERGGGVTGGEVFVGGAGVGGREGEGVGADVGPGGAVGAEADRLGPDPALRPFRG